MRVVFSDIDGTLLNSKHKVHDLHLEAIEKLNMKDIPFVIVSARSAPCIFPILEEAGFNCPIISCGGAVIMDKNRERIFEKGLKKEKVREIVEAINSLQKDVVINLYSKNQWISDKKYDARTMLEESIVGVSSEQGSVEDVQADTIDKILCILNDRELDEFEENLKQRFPELSIVKSCEDMLEIMESGVTKALGCQEFCNINNIDIKDAVAFGDNYNDEDMLSVVGHGYLMENAPNELIERLNKVTKSNDDGGIFHKLVELGII